MELTWIRMERIGLRVRISGTSRFADENQWNDFGLERVVLRARISGTTLDKAGTSRFAGKNQ